MRPEGAGLRNNTYKELFSRRPLVNQKPLYLHHNKIIRNYVFVFTKYYAA